MREEEIKHYKRIDKELSRQGETVLGNLVLDVELDIAGELLTNGFKFTGKDRDLLLHVAKANVTASVPFLVKHGFDPDHANEAGETALHHADSGEMARALIRAGADPNKQDCYGNTPLHAAYNGSLATALLESGADLAIKKANGHTPCEALKVWAKADLGGDGYHIVQNATDAREQRDAILSSLSNAWKPSDCKEGNEATAKQEEPAQVRRRLM